jgi:hypothetical protein
MHNSKPHFNLFQIEQERFENRNDFSLKTGIEIEINSNEKSSQLWTKIVAFSSLRPARKELFLLLQQRR